MPKLYSIILLQPHFMINVYCKSLWNTGQHFSLILLPILNFLKHRAIRGENAFLRKLADGGGGGVIFVDCAKVFWKLSQCEKILKYCGIVNYAFGNVSAWSIKAGR